MLPFCFPLWFWFALEGAADLCLAAAVLNCFANARAHTHIYIYTHVLLHIFFAHAFV